MIDVSRLFSLQLIGLRAASPDEWNRRTRCSFTRSFNGSRCSVTGDDPIKPVSNKENKASTFPYSMTCLGNMLYHWSAKTVLLQSKISAWKCSVNYNDLPKPVVWIAKTSSAVRHKTMNKWSQGKIVFITSHQTETRKTILLKYQNTVLAKHSTDYYCVHKHIPKISTSGVNEVFVYYIPVLLVLFWNAVTKIHYPPVSNLF